MTIEGYFGGSWHTSIDIQRATLAHPKKRGHSFGMKAIESWRNSFSELQSVIFNLLFVSFIIDARIARLDGRIGTCTVLASNKWQSLFEECEKMLGFSGNAASDVLTAWSRIAAGTFDTYQSPTHSPMGGSPVLPSIRRASSLNTISKTVRAPGELISLERARAMTFQDSNEDEGSPPAGQCRTLDGLEASLMQLSIEHSHKLSTGDKIKISGPLHLQEEIASSYPPVGPGLTYSPHADYSPPPPPTIVVQEPTEHGSSEGESSSSETVGVVLSDTNRAIQKYIDQVRVFMLSSIW